MEKDRNGSSSSSSSAQPSTSQQWKRQRTCADGWMDAGREREGDNERTGERERERTEAHTVRHKTNRYSISTGSWAENWICFSYIMYSAHNCWLTGWLVRLRIYTFIGCESSHTWHHHITQLCILGRHARVYHFLTSASAARTCSHWCERVLVRLCARARCASVYRVEEWLTEAESRISAPANGRMLDVWQWRESVALALSQRPTPNVRLESIG